MGTRFQPTHGQLWSVLENFSRRVLDRVKINLYCSGSVTNTGLRTFLFATKIQCSQALLYGASTAPREADVRFFYARTAFCRIWPRAEGLLFSKNSGAAVRFLPAVEHACPCV